MDVFNLSFDKLRLFLIQSQTKQGWQMQQACLSLLFIAIIRTIRTISSQNSGYFEETIYIRLFCKGNQTLLVLLSQLLVSWKVVTNMWKKPEYKVVNTSSEVTMYAYIGK